MTDALVILTLVNLLLICTLIAVTAGHLFAQRERDRYKDDK